MNNTPDLFGPRARGRLRRAGASVAIGLGLSLATGVAGAYEQSIIRVNVGGPAYTDTQGRSWQADTGFNTGNVAPVSTAAIANTENDTLFQSQRWDWDEAPDLQYSFPVENGDYIVRLLLAETCDCIPDVGMRQFDVAVEGQVVAQSLDILAEAGGHDRALERRFPTTVQDGQIDVRFLHRVEDPTVAGIEIIRLVDGEPEQTGIQLESWTDVDGLTVDELQQSTGYPDSPDDTRIIDHFEVRDGLVAADNYGSRLRGYVLPPATGYYRFFVAGDDQATLRLSADESPDNSRVIAQAPSWTHLREWDLYSEQTSEAIYLQQGQRYYIEALHKEAFGDGHVSVAWQRLDSQREVIAGEYLRPWTGGDTADAPTDGGGSGSGGTDSGSGATLQPGLEGRYYAGDFDSEPVIVRVDEQVAFRWRNGSPDGLPRNDFQVRWQGWVTPAHASGSRTYTFHTISDDGVRLWVGDTLLIDNWTPHAATEDTGSITLQAGESYPIRMEFFESRGHATAELYWSNSSLSRQLVPTGNLSTAAPTTGSTDSDGDGVPDSEDAFPNDPSEQSDLDGDGIGDNADSDTDGDGMPNDWESANGLDPYSADDASADPDGDGSTNLEEYRAGTDPLTAPEPVDSDGDGVPDSEDAFPNDPSEQYDLDGDGIGDNADSDTDGDGLPDDWESANGLDPYNADDASLDPDGDGYTNAEEYEAGSDPQQVTTPDTSADGTVLWTAPTQRADGSPLSMSEIGGYYVNYGTASGQYTSQVRISDAYTTEHTFTELTPGETYYISIQTFGVDGTVSAYSTEVTFTP